MCVVRVHRGWTAALRVVLAALYAAGLAACVADTSVTSPALQRAQIVSAFVETLNAHNVEATLGFFAPQGQMTESYGSGVIVMRSGRTEITERLRYLKEQHAVITLAPLSDATHSGDMVMLSYEMATDAFLFDTGGPVRGMLSVTAQGNRFTAVRFFHSYSASRTQPCACTASGGS